MWKSGDTFNDTFKPPKQNKRRLHHREMLAQRSGQAVIGCDKL